MQSVWRVVRIVLTAFPGAPGDPGGPLGPVGPFNQGKKLICESTELLKSYATYLGTSASWWSSSTLLSSLSLAYYLMPVAKNCVEHSRILHTHCVSWWTRGSRWSGWSLYEICILLPVAQMAWLVRIHTYLRAWFACPTCTTSLTTLCVQMAALNELQGQPNELQIHLQNGWL